MISHPMFYSSAGESLTASFEGCRLAAYQDQGGVWTIGYGHTVGVKQFDTCTREQALAWLLRDSQWAVDTVNRLVSVSLTQGEFDALVDFTFNAGPHAIAGSTLLRVLNSGDYAAAADQFDLWDHCGGQVVAGLLRRRQAETAEFQSGASS